jgi:hypothetical protein
MGGVRTSFSNLFGNQLEQANYARRQPHKDYARNSLAFL